MSEFMYLIEMCIILQPSSIMCSPVVAELTESLLANYRANQLGVSFAGKVLKWNTGEDGNFQ